MDSRSRAKGIFPIVASSVCIREPMAAAAAGSGPPRRPTSTQVAVRHLDVLEAGGHSIGSEVRYRCVCCDSRHLLHAARLRVLVLHEPCTSSLQCMPECVLLQQGTSVWTLACPPRDMLCVASQAKANHLPRPQTWLSHSFIASVVSIAR